jgi:hypothetical protein
VKGEASFVKGEVWNGLPPCEAERGVSNRAIRRSGWADSVVSKRGSDCVLVTGPTGSRLWVEHVSLSCSGSAAKRRESDCE